MTFNLNLLDHENCKKSARFFKSSIWYGMSRSSHREVFLRKGALKLCSKFTGEHPCRIALRHGCSPANLLHIFRTSFPRNTSGWLLLYVYSMISTINKPTRATRETTTRIDHILTKTFLDKPLKSGIFKSDVSAFSSDFSNSNRQHIKRRRNLVYIHKICNR